MTALLTGGGGRLASALAAALRGHAYSHADLVITDQPAVERGALELELERVFGCAASHNALTRLATSCLAIGREIVDRVAGTH
jgi:hypothetical protein